MASLRPSSVEEMSPGAKQDHDLVDAARRGDLERVSELIAQSASVNGDNFDHGSVRPLHAASEFGYLEVVKRLVNCGAEVDGSGQCGCTPLMLAAEHGHLEIVEYLARKGADLNATTMDGRTPLMLSASGWTPLIQAIKGGHLSVVQFLVDNGALVDLEDDDGWTPILQAIKSRQPKALEYLARSIGRPLLLILAEVSRLDVVQNAVKSGADVNATDSYGKTALMLATRRNRLDVVQYLVGAGADVNAEDKRGWTSLMVAACRGYLEVVQCLVSQSANVKAVDSFGRTPLILAASSKKWAIVHHLVGCARDVDINAVDYDGWTPLMHSAYNGHFDTVKILKKRGADINAANATGETPLFVASKGGHANVVNYLIQEGADNNVTNSEGYTLLMAAADHGFIEVVQLLVESGVDVNTKNEQGWTALMFAATHGMIDIAKYLLRKGADANALTLKNESALHFAAKHDHHTLRCYLLNQHTSVHTLMKDDQSQRDKVGTPQIQEWFIAPFEIETIQLLDGDTAGGEFRAMWLESEVTLQIFTSDASNSTLEREISVWHRLRHPNIVRLYGACNLGHLYFVFEHTSNGSAFEYLTRVDSNSHTPWTFVHQAALGLSYMHERGIIHGNLNGRSIRIGDDGVAKLGAFGLSASSRNTEILSRKFTGHLRWQSPEQLNGERTTFASDVYSFGLCIFQLVSGQVPWQDDASDKDESLLRFENSITCLFKQCWEPESDSDPMDEPGELNDSLRELLAQMCCHDPRRRISATYCARILEQYKILEQNDNQLLQPEPEPMLTLTDFQNGELIMLWEGIKYQNQTGEFFRLPCRLLTSIENIFSQLLQQSLQQLSVLRIFHELLVDIWNATRNKSHINRILRLSSTGAVRESFHSLQERAKRIERLIGANTQAIKTLVQAHEFSLPQMFVSEVSKTWMILGEFQSVEESTAFLNWMRSEIKNQSHLYADEQVETMRKAFSEIQMKAGSNREPLQSIPVWFVPWYELVVDEWHILGKGGYGSVFRAKWLDSEVVVKRVGADCDNDYIGASYLSSNFSSESGLVRHDNKQKVPRETFIREASIWFNLSHPHVIRLFGACHVGNPFFVCEYAANGSLDTYLRKHPSQIWKMLHQTALGIQYLHERGVVHCDLKCNNIVVGNDYKAKVTDFGLSLTSSNNSGDIGDHISAAWHWTAPELLMDQGKSPTFSSDVFSFGMCIVEALRIISTDKELCDYTLPWRSLDNVEVKYYAVRGQLPPRPTKCTDAQWQLVKKMCQLKPTNRIRICSVVDELAAMATNVYGVPEEGSSNSEWHSEFSHCHLIARRHIECWELESNCLRSSDVLQLVYKLLWDRLSDIFASIHKNQAVGSRLKQLVLEAEAATAQARALSDSLVEFSHMAMKAYTLHRRLDKFMVAEGVPKGSRNAEEVNIHQWKTKCWESLGVSTEG